jgi:hypothetical protein
MDFFAAYYKENLNGLRFSQLKSEVLPERIMKMFSVSD